jgi:AmmeMemoRadiSam system protein B
LAKKQLVRRPAVAGIFYEENKDLLVDQIKWAFLHPYGPKNLPQRETERRKPRIKVAITPHSGLMYSGPIAAHVYYQLALDRPAQTYVIVGPNHTGLGAPIAVYPAGKWVTPLGTVDIDNEFVEELERILGEEHVDEKAHLFEHSIEVQLPFLQYLFGSSFRIVPIVMYEQSQEAAEIVASAIYEAAKNVNRDIVLIATSDLSHYLDNENAHRIDSKIINTIVSLNPDDLYRVVEEEAAPICGIGPLGVSMYYSKYIGASEAMVLGYATSGDIAGGNLGVVGYASIIIV